MDKNSNLSSQKYNFKIMKIETKLKQKLFDKGTLTWKNESHAENEQKIIKAVLRIFDFVSNLIQFESFFCDFVLYWSWSNIFDFKGSSILKFCHWSKFQVNVSFSSIFIIDYVHIGYNQKSKLAKKSFLLDQVTPVFQIF